MVAQRLARLSKDREVVGSISDATNDIMIVRSWKENYRNVVAKA